MRNQTYKGIEPNNAKVRAIIALLLLATTSSIWAQDNKEPQWWFNVELIVFKRELLPTNNENFDNVQFDLDFAGSNDLLYMEALKHTFQYRPLENALLQCGTDIISNSKYGISVDFEYVPNLYFEPTNDEFADSNVKSTVESTVESTEDSTEDDANNQIGTVSLAPNNIKSNDVDSNETSPDTLIDDSINKLTTSITLTESNSSMMKALLTPIIVETSAQVVQETNILVSAKENDSTTATKEQANEGIDPKSHRINIGSIIDEFDTQLIENKAPNIQIACLQSQTTNIPLSESALSIIGPHLFSKTSEFTGRNEMISKEEVSLNDYTKQIFRQRDIQPLLYTAWRQNVEFGIDNAEFYKVRAGNRLETAKKVNYDEWLDDHQTSSDERVIDVEEDTFFEDLKTALKTNQAIDWLTSEKSSKNEIISDFVAQTKYEIEGKFKVYLDHVNQVPYLHIDSQFNHYKLALDETGSSFLNVYPFKQRRRIISKQVHYFDHPAFGIVVRLERFNPPAIEVQVIEDDKLVAPAEDQ